MKNKFIIASIFALALISGVIASVYYTSPHKALGESGATMDWNLAASKGVLCASSNTNLVATSTSYQYLSISNDSSVPVFINFGLPAVLHQGIFLAASSSLVFTGGVQPAGQINCIASVSASTTILVLP